MKRLFLMLTMFVVSITSCFAYNSFQELIHGSDIYSGKNININAYCYEVQLNAYWSGFSEGSSGCVVCAEPSGVTIGEYSWVYGVSEIKRYQASLYGTYLGYVIFYLEAFQCYGEATLMWRI